MSIPPAFGDIGKSASDLFKKGYTLGQVKLEASSVARNGCEFKAVTASGDSRVSGSLEAKQKVPKYGMTATGKWNTDNAFNLNIAVENKFVDGLKVTFDSTVQPHAGRRTANTKATYKRPHVQATAALNMDGSNTEVRMEDVFCYEKFIGGVGATYNLTAGSLGAHSVSLAYDAADFGVSAGVSNFAKNNMSFSGSLFHRVSSSLQAGAQIRHTPSASEPTSLDIGTKYACSASASSLQAKVNSRGILGLSYGVDVRSGVKLTLSTSIDALHLDQPKHQLGLGIDLSSK